MALEQASYVSQLVDTNPAANDPVSEGYLQIELIKQVLLSTFPNFGSEVTTSPAYLNALDALLGAAPGNQVILTAGSSDPTVTIAATANGYTMSVTPAPTTAVPNPVASQALSADPTGAVTATVSLNTPKILENGNRLLPPGCILLWSGSVAAIPAGYALCDGTNGTPNLVNRFVVAAGDTKAQVPATYGPGGQGGFDEQSMSTQSAGVHNHGGRTGASQAQTIVTSTDVQGAHAHTGSTSAVALSVGQVPSLSYTYLFYQPANQGGSGTNFGGATGGDSEIYYRPLTGQTSGGGGSHAHGISTDGAHQHTVNVNLSSISLPIAYDGAHVHLISWDNRPAYYALCYIMKL